MAIFSKTLYSTSTHAKNSTTAPTCQIAALVEYKDNHYLYVLHRIRLLEQASKALQSSLSHKNTELFFSITAIIHGEAGQQKMKEGHSLLLSEFCILL